MYKKRKVFTLALTLICLCGTISIPVNAKEKTGGEGSVHVTYVDSSGVAEFTGNPFYNPLSQKQTKGIFKDYNLTADKNSEQRNCTCESNSGYDFQCTGWVDIVHKQSGTGLYHSTTAALSLNAGDEMYKGAVRNEGSGKVYATSDWVHGWAVPRIFWDWVN
ncbi:hypothetical protein [Eisenbergiella sp.]